MIAAGCAIPFVLMLIGAAIGAALGGDRGGLFGFLIGLAVGVVIMLGGLWGFSKLRDE